MTPQQQKILNDAAKRMKKEDRILTGGSKYINPKRVLPPKKKKSFLDRLFS